MIKIHLKYTYIEKDFLILIDFSSICPKSTAGQGHYRLLKTLVFSYRYRVQSEISHISRAAGSGKPQTGSLQPLSCCVSDSKRAFHHLHRHPVQSIMLWNSFPSGMKKIIQRIMLKHTSIWVGTPIY